MSLSKSVFLPAAFLLLFTSVVFFWKHDQPENADAITCAVYQAFFEQLPDKKAVFVNSTSNAYAYFPSEYVPQAPKVFERDTAEQRIVNLGPDTTPVTVPAREKFEHDTAAFFHPVIGATQQNIKWCFQNQSQAPGVFDGPFDLLYMREHMLGHTDHNFVSLWTVSTVGFSDDGHFAILYAGKYCGSLCGWGGFILMENTDGHWRVAGDKWLWVS